jgi:hypothetical protein
MCGERIWQHNGAVKTGMKRRIPNTNASDVVKIIENMAWKKGHSVTLKGKPHSILM